MHAFLILLRILKFFLFILNRPRRSLPVTCNALQTTLCYYGKRCQVAVRKN